MPGFNFNLKQTGIYKALRWQRILCLGTLRKLRKILSVFFVIFLSLCILGNFFNFAFSSFLGVSIFVFCLAGLIVLIEAFFKFKLKKPAIKNKENLAEFLNFETAKAVQKSIKWARRKKCETNSNFLFYFLLIDNQKLNFVFQRALLSLEKIKKTLEGHLKNVGANIPDRATFSECFQKTILGALKRAQERGGVRVEITDLIVALAQHNSIFQKILIENNLKVEDIENLAWWLENLEWKVKERKKFWSAKNLARMGTLAKEWAAGYTLTLDKYSLDLTDVVKKRLPEVVGHQEEIKMVETILSRTKINNVLLVGEAGTGRRSIVQALALKSFLGESSEPINYKRIVELDMPSFLARLPDPEQVEENLEKIFQETVSAGNIILVIDEFHNYVGGEARPGVVDISGILGSYLHLPQFQIMAITTYTGLHQKIEQNPSILNLFEKVEVSEIPQEETLQLLESLCLRLEKTHKVLISQPALREIISLAAQYLPNLPFPKKAIDLLDEVAAFVATSTKDPVVLPSHVAKVIAEKVEVPVGELAGKEKKLLLNLEELIHKRIINQDEAVREISEALRRARAKITIRKGPMGSFLFLGPTGVGKTETSKVLAEIYFRSEKRMIRLDMSEFQAIKDIPRLIGELGQEGLLTTPVRENPFSLILLDEIEKAHPNILNLFLQVLDEGYLTDGQGRKVSFQNSIIIATSNAGYKIILKALREKTEWSQVKQKLLDELFEKEIFRPEFINRFDAVVVFRPLTKDNLLDIAQLMFQDLKKNLKGKDIDFIITDALKEKIVKLGYSPTFGAREMRRVIQDKVENVLAKAILSGELKKGDRVELDPETFKVLL